MKKLITILCFLVLLYGCKKESETHYKNLHNVELSGLTIPLPGIYEEISIDDLIESWTYSENPSYIIEMKVKHLETMRSWESSFAIFVDTTDIRNYVTILKGPRIRTSQWTSRQLFTMAEKRLRQEADYLGAEFKPLENFYYTLNNGNDVLKMKFEWTNNSIKTYGTEYVLNTKGATFGVLVVSSNDDFEDLIKRARFSFDQQ